MFEDIGSILFRDILQMTAYPGSPFTGNIINDLVMFFFIPTVFIIVVIYTLAGRLTDHPKLDLLLSIAFYLFIIFGGLYPMFAYLAGPYFLFMLIFVGLFMFFVGHFGRKGSQGSSGSRGGREHPMPGTALSSVFGSSTEDELVHEYEMICKMVSQGEDELRRLEDISRKSPGSVDRELQVQKESVNHSKNEMRKLELALNKRKLGYNTKTTLKNIREMFGMGKRYK